tara:strand:- start:1101 stop:1493 length:393 start_codon:yes stop_codon:yes gene_type:complete
MLGIGDLFNFLLKLLSTAYAVLAYVLIRMGKLLKFVWKGILLIISGTYSTLMGNNSTLAATSEAMAESLATLQENPIYMVFSAAFKIVAAATLVSLIASISGMGGFILFFVVFYIYIKGVLTYDPNKYIK